MNIIEAKELTHSYIFEGSKHTSLNKLSLEIKKGELVAVLGHNGSGKTTLARHFNALIPLQSGELHVAGLDVRDEKSLWEIRRACGMVFQNPDNQFVSSVIEEDIAFGPRNFGETEETISQTVKKALETVGMGGYEKHSSQLLSGGQKQRVAIAGVLASNPEIMIFDEVTSMLDPQGRAEVLDTIKRLKKEGKTIIMISHYVEEAVFADRVVLIHDGAVIAQGTPREMLTDEYLLKRTGIEPPLAVRVYNDLKKKGIILGKCPLTKEELTEELCRLN